MAWIEQVKKDYTITTGDGKKYTVNWLNARKMVEYNIAMFNFKDLSGTLVKRGVPMGTKYAIEIYFQGADNLDKSKAFQKSAANTKAWTVSHPMYGSLYVQPTSLEFDDSAYNVTKITGEIVETIGSSKVKPTTSPSDTIVANKSTTDSTLAASYANNVPKPKATDISAMKANTATINTGVQKFAVTDIDLQTATNYYYQANAAINGAVTAPLNAVSAMQGYISLIMNFTNSVSNRVNFINTCLNDLAANIDKLATSTTSLKRLFENNSGTLITTMCGASVTNVDTTSYPNRDSVLAIISTVSGAYNAYIANLDSLQTDNGAETTSYIPDFDSLEQLQQLVMFTISNLFDIAASAKQQRVLYTSTDSNIILIANAVYGLDVDDTTIDQLINDNGIGLNEMLTINKGRKIIYYI